MIRLILLTILFLNNSLSSQAQTQYPYSLNFEDTESIDWGTLTDTEDCTDRWYTIETPHNPNSGAASAYSGSKYLNVYYFDCTGIEKIVESPQFDLADLTLPTFSFFYHMYGNEMGVLKLEVSTDNGASWNSTALWEASGQQSSQTNASAPWLQGSVDLSAYLNQTIKLRFMGVVGGANSVFSLDLFRLFDANDGNINGQGDVFYTYDEAGNRTSRQYTVAFAQNPEAVAAARSAIDKDVDNGQSLIDPSLVNVYPNPVSDFINIDLGTNAGVSDFYVFDMLGRVLETRSISGSFSQLDMSNYEAGSYILMVRNGEEEIVRQIVKN